MFQRGPQPGYSPKALFKEFFPNAHCKQKYTICDIRGYLIYPSKEDAENDTNAICSAQTAKEAWSKAIGLKLKWAPNETSNYALKD